jgi:hypothetical protein
MLNYFDADVISLGDQLSQLKVVQIDQEQNYEEFIRKLESIEGAISDISTMVCMIILL